MLLRNTLQPNNDRRQPLLTWLPWRQHTAVLTGSVRTWSENSRTLSYSGERLRRRKQIHRKHWRRRYEYKKKGKGKTRQPMMTYTQLPMICCTGPLLTKDGGKHFLTEPPQQQQLQRRILTPKEHNGKQRASQRYLLPMRRASLSCQREWKPSQRHVEARAGLARDMAASAPSSSVAASSAEVAAEAASSSAAAAAAALRVTPSSLAATNSAPAVTPSAPVVSLQARPPPVPEVATTAPTTAPAAIGVKVAGDDPVVARMRRQMELCKMVQASCPGMSHQNIQEMALACMGETPSAPPAGGGSSSSAPTVSMTPVGPAHSPQFPPPQHMADDPGRVNVNFSGPEHEGTHHNRGFRDDRYHAQHCGQHHQDHRGARGQGFKKCDELAGVAESVVGALEGGVGGDDSGGVAEGVPISGGVLGGGPSIGGTVGLGYDGSHGDTGRCVPGHEFFPAGGVGKSNTADLGPGVYQLW